jgi:plastocyanin
LRYLDSPARRTEPGAPPIVLIVAAMLMATEPLTVHAARPGAKGGGHAHTVTIEGMRFSPQTLRVRRGDRITWVNKDPFPHTVTATGGKFDSHRIAAGGAWTYVARQAGEYHYACTLHVDMKGTLQVR